MISVLKENSAATFVESIPYVTSHVVTQGLKVTAFMKAMGSDLVSSIITIPKQKNFTSLSPPLTGEINLGTIAMLYYKRWTIEKAFNNSKRN
ncbi:MAG: hypothetical protein ABGX72_08485 [Methyloprofundus sp.]